MNNADVDFSLMKYFASYRNTIRNVIKDEASVVDCVIATNIGFDEEDLKKRGVELVLIETEDKILDFDGGKRYRLNFKDKTALYDQFKECSSSYKLAKLISNCIDANKSMNLRNELFSSILLHRGL